MMNNSLTHTAGRFSSVARLALAHKAAGSVDTYVPQLRTALLLYNALVYICRKERGPQTLLPPSVCTRYRAPEIVHTTVTYTLTHTHTVDTLLTYTALSVSSHYISCGAGAGEGTRGVSTKDITLTGLQARHSSQRTLIYICI